jgi:transposase-like protein
MLRYRTVAAVRLHIGRSERIILKALTLVRFVMEEDVPLSLSGVVEVDETYIAGMWHNKPWSIRKQGTKRGRGTSKQAIFGLRERKRGVVRAFFIPDVKKRTIMPIIKSIVERGSTIYSDAYQLYQETPKEGYLHAFVDHHQNEYGRGDVHSNGMEGFWGYLKRRLKVTGGIRRSRLHLYVAEEVWRYNHRGQKEETRIERLFGLLLKKFGG